MSTILTGAGQRVFVYQSNASGVINYVGSIAAPVNNQYFAGGAVATPWNFGGYMQLHQGSVIVSYPSERSGQTATRNNGSFATDQSINMNGAVYVFE